MRSRLTPYGEKCREFRRRYNLVMADQARGLGLSVACISAIERGEEPIPIGYTAELSHWMSLPTADADFLASLEGRSRRKVEIPERAADQGLLGFEFSESTDGVQRRCAIFAILPR